jgi:hypothetical protein
MITDLKIYVQCLNHPLGPYFALASSGVGQTSSRLGIVACLVFSCIVALRFASPPFRRMLLTGILRKVLFQEWHAFAWADRYPHRGGS